MFRFLTLALLLTGLSAGAALAQNRAPVTPTRHQPAERISPVPGVVLPTGASQAAAEPLPVPVVEPNARLAMPYMPSGQVIVDSVQVQPATPAPTTRPLRKRGRSNRQ
ncbi:hypothetical protein [Hymenobacter rubripertinctus]|uniref:Uncharacterized protein n=1 Tax=Hymenobacter rubripertinctus TaxID=2029981 RepID=A0A418R268_9BACT|nr:hypothetical protein [Hymenobacter rubripertinctus]RIY11580.1 hypothetical protein D0T11_07160 [Hymenobacter rubripertinctus]